VFGCSTLRRRRRRRRSTEARRRRRRPPPPARQLAARTAIGPATGIIILPRLAQNHHSAPLTHNYTPAMRVGVRSFFSVTLAIVVKQTPPSPPRTIAPRELSRRLYYGVIIMCTHTYMTYNIIIIILFCYRDAAGPV